MARVTKADLREFKRALMKTAPPLFPVRCYLIRTDSAHGFCNLSPKKDGSAWSHFVIQISDALDYDAAWNTLMHEWAHAIAWSDSHPNTKDHDPLWGVAFAKVYSAWADSDEKD